LAVTVTDFSIVHSLDYLSQLGEPDMVGNIIEQSHHVKWPISMKHVQLYWWMRTLKI